MRRAMFWLASLSIVALSGGCGVPNDGDTGEREVTKKKKKTTKKAETPGVRCESSECGDPIEAPSYLCDDGVSWAGPVCQRLQDGKCGWDFAPCPEPVDECREEQCGEPPMAPSQQCDDGSWAGPVCTRLENGTCGWTITNCSCGPTNPCPDNQLCELGTCVDVRPCSPDNPCGPGEQCTAGRCEPIPYVEEPGCSPVKPCPVHQQCIAGNCEPIPCDPMRPCPANLLCVGSVCIIGKEPCTEPDGINPCLPWQECDAASHQCVDRSD